MNRQSWENWLHISSTAAVLIGVVLVIAQLRQNAELLELQIIKQEADSYIQHFTEVLPEDFTDTWMKSFDNPQALTRQEIFEVDLYMYARTVARWRSMYDLADRELLDDSEWRRLVAEDAPVVLGNPFGRVWWEGIKDWGEGILPDKLVNAIDQAVIEASPNSTSDWYDDLERRIGIDRAVIAPTSSNADDPVDGEGQED